MTEGAERNIAELQTGLFMQLHHKLLSLHLGVAVRIWILTMPGMFFIVLCWIFVLCMHAECRACQKWFMIFSTRHFSRQMKIFCWVFGVWWVQYLMSASSNRALGGPLVWPCPGWPQAQTRRNGKHLHANSISTQVRFSNVLLSWISSSGNEAV